ncbi:MAG: hypothetical protein H0X02_11215 [Nitrosomonas sp.]|nr:hypothetical protein [Nitrosomonas sp.]
MNWSVWVPAEDLDEIITLQLAALVATLTIDTLSLKNREQVLKRRILDICTVLVDVMALRHFDWGRGCS